MTRILRIYHAGRDAAHRARDRALSSAGVDVVQVVPAQWPDPGSQQVLTAEPFPVFELDVRRAGDVNRHRYADPTALRRLLAEHRPDLVDLHEEPFSLVTRQWLAVVGDLPVVGYTAQNLDKRFPPPFAQYERAALRRLDGCYPCSRQAASVIRGKGLSGPISVLPLGYDDDVFHPGRQSLDDDPLVLALVGRLVPEKGVLDAIQVLAAVRQERKAVLWLVGEGPDRARAQRLADDLGVGDAIEFVPWQSAGGLAELYRKCHLVLVPSRSTATWVEQFGRVIVEAQACGAVVAGYASGAIPEVVGDAGLLAPEGDREQLTRLCVALLDDPIHFDQLRRRGLAAARDRTWSQVALGQLALYRRVLDGSRPPARTGRAPAVREFGPPATCLGQPRPFALPMLCQPSTFSRLLGSVLDATRGGRDARGEHESEVARE